mmetsp:Transcript_22820/g.51464  ORF Transcript_22820/g.51464 Transcript_22820/m.51464 type:complete len:225 (+) Transcript_22820:1012-1686(+)
MPASAKRLTASVRSLRALTFATASRTRSSTATSPEGVSTANLRASAARAASRYSSSLPSHSPSSPRSRPAPGTSDSASCKLARVASREDNELSACFSNSWVSFRALSRTDRKAWFFPVKSWAAAVVSASRASFELARSAKRSLQSASRAATLSSSLASFGRATLRPNRSESCPPSSPFPESPFPESALALAMACFSAFVKFLTASAALRVKSLRRALEFPSACP